MAELTAKAVSEGHARSSCTRSRPATFAPAARPRARRAITADVNCNWTIEHTLAIAPHLRELDL